MICSHCSNLTGKIVDMVHKEGVQVAHAPGNPHGYGEENVCWHECETCHKEEECDKRCKEPCEE